MTETSRHQRGTEPEYGLPFRRGLRGASTKPEQLVWAMVRNRRLEGAKFRRQHSIGKYIVDFVCIEHSLIVELDGGYHDYVVEQDLERERYLKQQGFIVLRFWNEDVLEDAEAVARGIANALKATPSPWPPPLNQGRGDGKENVPSPLARGEGGRRPDEGSAADEIM